MSMPLPPPDLMETLLKDPLKRALILNLLNKEKHNLEKYKQRQETQTPPKKPNTISQWESPTSIHRRRALLEQKNQLDTTSESSLSDLSEVGPKLPFEELLKGVRAYVEVKRDNEDRSEGIKAIMKLMGATIRDTFTNDVTHVIFKDGSFTTFEKAKLMKAHLVSVLWLDAVRKHHARVPEKNYPAFGSRVCDENVSILCSQIQRDYEEVVKDERRRRRSMMTPKTSISSFLTAEVPQISDDEISEKPMPSPELSSDESDCGMINGETCKRSKDVNLLQTMPDAASQISKNASSNESVSLLSHINRNKRKTINVSCTMQLTPNVNSASSEQIIEATPNKERAVPSKVLTEVPMQSSAKSCLGVSGSDKTKSDLDRTKSDLNNTKGSGRIKSLTRVSSDTDKTKSGLGNSNTSSKARTSLFGGKENCSAATLNTTMSSLRLSGGSESNEKRITRSSSNSNLASPTKRNQTTPSECSSIIDGVTPAKQNRRKTLGASMKKPKKPNEIISLLDESSNEDPTYQQNKSLTPSTKTLKKAISNSSQSKDDEKLPNRNITKQSKIISSEVSILEEQSSVTLDEPPKSRRPQSVTSTTSSDRLRRSRRMSVARSVAVAEELNVITTEKEKEKKHSRSVSNDKISTDNKKAQKSKEKSVRTPAKKTKIGSASEENDSETPKRNQKSIQTPSPAKKLKVVQTSGTSKTRKLYNPNEVSCLPYRDDDKEREEYIKQKSQKSPNDNFVDPNIIGLTAMVTKRKPNNITLDCATSTDNETPEESPQKKKTNKRKNKKSPPKQGDSDSDEQQELLRLITKSLETKKRDFDSLTFAQLKKKYSVTCESSQSTDSTLPITPIKRRSTMDFQPVTKQKHKLKLDYQKSSSIVCTKMHNFEVIRFEKIVAQIGRFFVEDKVTGKTSHLVVGEAKRTINMLRAIARGCWIVKHEWLLDSEKLGKWANEEDYELTEYSPAIQQCRLQREAFGPSYSMDIFENCGFIYIGKDTSPKPAELRELIFLCKGRLTTIYRNANIVVGEYTDREGVVCVTEKWILDSILYNKLERFKNYLIRPPTLNLSINNSPHY